MVDQATGNARRLTIWFTLASTLFVFALVPFSKLSLSAANASDIASLLAILLGFSIYCWKRGLVRLAPGLEAVALGVVLTIPILVSTYLAASLDQPLMDAPLVEADALLGIDWRSFVLAVDAHPWLAMTLQHAYSSFALQLLALPVLLSSAGKPQRAYVMIAAFGLLCYASSFISIWFPALGTYSVYGLAQGELHNINTHYGFAFLRDFTAVREHAEFTLSLTNASGIVTFPSVHAGGALVFASAAWGLRPLGLPLVAWNVLMAVSAVSHANHYVVDIIAGGAIAALSIVAIKAAVARMRPAAEANIASVPAQALAG